MPDMPGMWTSSRTAKAIERRIAAKYRTRMNDLRAALEDWKSKASTDPLTGAKTRLYLKNIPDTIEGGGVIMVDVDHFKRFNDTFGHGMGDDCLRSVAAALLSLGHTVVRMGGEEFLLFVEDGDPGEVAASLVSLVRDTVRDPDRNPVTVSAGAVIADRACGLADAISAADRLLYESKSGGRDRYAFGRMSEKGGPDSGKRRRFRDRPA